MADQVTYNQPTGTTTGGQQIYTSGLDSNAPTPPVTATPTPAPATAPAPAAPTTNINIGAMPQTDQQTQTPQQTQAPSVNLQPGAQGQDVSNLQNYLIDRGYLTPDQINGGQGVYGPQTTAAVAKLQKDIGVQAGNAAGYYGPQTQEALAQKYQGIFNAKQDTTVPNSAAEASSALSTISQTSTDPVFGSMASSLAPIMQSLSQVLQNINNPALTGVSLQSEYSQLASQYGLQDLQTQMLNDTRIMNGTEDDIRDEIAKAGGFATDSQVQAMSSARNKVIQKQYNVLATQYQAAQTNVQNMMQYATQDQSTQLQRDNLTANITQSMASIETQMMQMGMTMQNNARSAVQYNVTQMGYKGLAQSTGGDPAMNSYYENILGLAPGTLSNPATVAEMDTYKDQTLQLNNYKAAIQAYNAGYGGAAPGGGGGNAYQPNTYLPGPVQTPAGQIGITPVDSSTLTRPSWLNNNVPLSMSADQMTQYMNAQKSASVDPGTHNVIAPGIGYYLQQADGSYILKAALPSSTTQQYNQIQQTIQNAPQFSGSALTTRRWSLSANAAMSSFKDLGTYQVLSNVAPYLANIRAASQNPNSVSDLELLDSYVRASKGGTGQVTDTQVDTILKGSSIADSYQQLENKLKAGGVLSPQQRSEIQNLATSVYKENADDYQKIYVQAIQNMQSQGIPAAFWGQLPDLNALMKQ